MAPVFKPAIGSFAVNGTFDSHTLPQSVFSILPVAHLNDLPAGRKAWSRKCDENVIRETPSDLRSIFHVALAEYYDCSWSSQPLRFRESARG